MKHLDLKKYAEEVNALQDLPPASVELPPLAALAIISHIQLATRHPGIVNENFTKIAIDTARQLQNLFSENSETYKVLELGWNPSADILVPDGTCAEPCEDFLQLRYCPCSGTKFAGVVMEQFTRVVCSDSWEDYAGEDIMDRYVDPEEFNTDCYTDC